MFSLLAFLTLVAACAVEDRRGGTEGLSIFFVPRDPAEGVEIARATERREMVVQACRSCGGHCYHRDAKYCMHCGVPLEF